MKSFLILLLAIPTAVSAQYRFLGADDEAMGRSSGAWHQSASAVFSNPAGLAYLLQTEGSITNTETFKTTFVGGSLFHPSVGTVALGAYRSSDLAPKEETVSLGYAHQFYSSVAVGISAGGRLRNRTFVPVLGTGIIVRPSYGTLLQNFTFGAYLQDISFDRARRDPYGSIAMAYWLLNDRARLQASYSVIGHIGTVQAGIEGRVLDWLVVRGGIDRGKTLTGGIGLVFPFIRIDVAAGKGLFLMSFTPRLGTAWYEKRDRHFEEGVQFYKQQRYTQAMEEFEWALRYDRNYYPAREYRSAAESAYRMKVEEYYERGKLLVLKKQYKNAIVMFEAALAINPNYDSSRVDLAMCENMLRGLVDSALTTGRRYWNQRQYRQAHAMFVKTLEYDSTNFEARRAIVEIDTARTAMIDSLVHAGDAAVRQSLLETARRSFELALSLDPGNPALTRRLNSINEKVTIRDLIGEGKRQLTLGDPQAALRAFRSALDKEPTNNEAWKNVGVCLEMLKDVIDRLFQQGLHAYANEEYESAIDLFSQVVAIKPSHRAAREYLQRANEKLKALEQLP